MADRLTVIGCTIRNALVYTGTGASDPGETNVSDAGYLGVPAVTPPVFDTTSATGVKPVAPLA